jgi:hypothetical protein
VNADMLYLDPNNSNFTELMPGGDLAALRSNSAETQLFSYGMTEVSLTDNAGNPLQLKEGASSELTFPIPAGMESNPPATIPLWYFDEQRGIWVEEGVATLRGDMYEGSVTHFSWHNLDVPSERVTIRGTVRDCENKPVSYVKVTVDQTAAATNSRGEYTVYVPANTPVTVTVKSRDYSNYSPVVEYGIPGKPGGTVVTQDISLPCRTTEPPDDAMFTVDKASVTYIIDGDEMIITFDAYGKRLRMDTDYGTDRHSVVIFDDIAQSYFVGGSAEQWFSLPYEGMSATAEGMLAIFLFRDELYENLPGFAELSNETIAGKACRIITYTYDGCQIKYGGWNGLVMLIEDCEGTSLVATNVSLNVPANAFTQTLNIFD